MENINPLQTKKQFDIQKQTYLDLFGACFTYEDDNGYNWNLPPHRVIVSSRGLVNARPERRFWLSIRKAKGCLLSRRNGCKGKIIAGYSVCLRLFGKTIL